MSHGSKIGISLLIGLCRPLVEGRERIVGGRFEREARAAARLSHPAIVTLYEAAVDDEGAYLVSEIVYGSTLDTLLAEGRLSDRDIVGVGMALCDALEHAHAQGVVHRDLKPSNVLIPDAPPSAAQCAKLTDFGVARLVGAESLTLTGDVIGTLAYMAPEQAGGQEAGPAADLYSLALVLYGSQVKTVWAPDFPWAPRFEDHMKTIEEAERHWGTRAYCDQAAARMAPSGDESFRRFWGAYMRHGASPASAAALMRKKSGARCTMPLRRGRGGQALRPS